MVEAPPPEYRLEVPTYVCNCGEAFVSPWLRLAHWQGCEANTERREPPQFREGTDA